MGDSLDPKNINRILKKYIGKVVVVDFSRSSGKESSTGTLAEAYFPVAIKLNYGDADIAFRKVILGSSIPFAGYDGGITNIQTGDGKTIYEQPNMPVPYPDDFIHCLDAKKLSKLRIQIFGDKLDPRYLHPRHI